MQQHDSTLDFHVSNQLTTKALLPLLMIVATVWVVTGIIWVALVLSPVAIVVKVDTAEIAVSVIGACVKGPDVITGTRSARLDVGVAVRADQERMFVVEIEPIGTAFT